MSSARAKLNRPKRRWEATYRRGYEEGKRTAQQEIGVSWLPIDQADRSITDVQDFSEVGVTLRLSERYWVRDEDGRIYEAVWTDDKAGYWWDLEGESPVDPVEFMPHPLDARFTGSAAPNVAGLSEWEGWDKSRDFWSETKHRDAVMYAMFRGPWSMEDAATLLGFIDRTWPKAAAKHEGDETATSQLTLQEDADCCIACDAPLIEGDLVYWDVSDTGYLHADCCGPEREGYVNEDGEPLKDGDPIPQPFPYKPDRAAGYIYTGGEKE